MQRIAPLIVFGISLVAHSLIAAEILDPAEAQRDAETDTLWYDVRQLGIEGQGWRDTEAPFDRLPARAENLVRPAVWSLSRHSAGLAVRFITDAPVIRARWTLTSDRVAMPHMAATGVSGLDLYARSDDGQWRWLAVGQPRAATNVAALVSGLPAGEREYLLYLPLYNGVRSVEIGIPERNRLARAETRPAERRAPVVFYGTSITQGACASRPGMVHTAILGRRLERPVINLGFSGNGEMEPEIAELMAEIEAAAYVIDCLPNLNAEEVAQRTEPLVRILRQAWPKTPIVLVEDRTYADAFLLGQKAKRNAENRAALRRAYERLIEQGVGNLHYVEGEELLGSDGEATVDSSHPTDLGFIRQADALERALRKIVDR